MVNAPEFLREHIIREFDTAFEEHGLTRNDSESDLRVRFIYKYIRLDAVQGDIDLVSEEEAIESDVHYKEVISIDLFETDTGYHIRGGEISRILSISPLDYGIEERNKNDLLSAFRRFLTAVLSS
jgi:hypothetical protein|tara:strand:- start:70 stop:444 length:375 start_codon:yes stop_codon:yes gene_type:complete